MMIKKIHWTDEMLQFVKDNSFSAREVAEILGLRVGSIRNKRKSLGVKSNQSLVMSKPRPYQRKRKIVTCIAIDCNESFEANQASKKKFCSTSCQMKTQNPSYKGMPRPKRNPNIKEYTRYSRKVHKMSDETYQQYKDIINPNDYPRTLCGVENGWQLDHIKSVKDCFDEGISIEEASRLENLRMLPWRKNLMRNFDGN